MLAVIMKCILLEKQHVGDCGMQPEWQGLWDLAKKVTSLKQETRVLLSCDLNLAKSARLHVVGVTYQWVASSQAVRPVEQIIYILCCSVNVMRRESDVLSRPHIFLSGLSLSPHVVCCIMAYSRLDNACLQNKTRVNSWGILQEVQASSRCTRTCTYTTGLQI